MQEVIIIITQVGNILAMEMTNDVRNGESAWFGKFTVRKRCLELQVHRKRGP